MTDEDHFAAANALIAWFQSQGIPVNDAVLVCGDFIAGVIGNETKLQREIGLKFFTGWLTDKVERYARKLGK